MPFPLGLAPLSQPVQHMKGLTRFGLQREGRRMDPYYYVGVLAHGRGHTAAIAVAPVRHNHLAGLPLIPRQVFPAPAVCDTDLVHPTGPQVVGQMQPPVVAGPTGLVETARIHE